MALTCLYLITKGKPGNASQRMAKKRRGGQATWTRQYLSLQGLIFLKTVIPDPDPGSRNIMKTLDSGFSPE
jgi:hypothetical protein